MTMRIYTSSDTSAPTLQGVVGGAFGTTFAAGSFVEVLRQILVSGYGSTTAAGWTMPYTGVSRASFKQGAGCGFYLDVLDDGSLTAGAREAQLIGYEIMTASATGTGLFPTAAQQATGVKFRKSETADATVRPWICFADSSTFYFYSVPQYPSGTLYYAGCAFGNFHSLATVDAYNCMVIGRVTSAVIDTTTNEGIDLISSGTSITVASTGHYLARGYTQAGSAQNFGNYHAFAPLGGFSNQGIGVGTTSNPYPNPADNTLIVCRSYVIDSSASLPNWGIRGWLKGFYGIGQSGTSIPLGLPFTGTGALAGRTFKLMGLRTGSGASGRIVMETSDTWDS